MARTTARGVILLLALSLAPCALPPANAGPGDIFIYRQRDGSRLFTDQHKAIPGNVYIGRFGRPTAFSSCKGLSKAALKSRAESLQVLIAKYATAYGIPAELVSAVMHVESCYDQRAVSRVGARGLMQLMPDTAALLGVKDSFDAAQNIEGGTRYLSMMRQRFPKDWKLVLAAYNAGPEAVDKYGDIPPFPETMSYVKRVMLLYQKASPTPTSFSAMPAPPAGT